ncbi:conserved hypothetical protein [Leishmania infantum JPCM5]|uniref:Putative_serine_esterase_(DUF676)_-_putative n=2 Tax=Leishmania infantum TaxID=5671 RepID=A0A6L0XT42_LEIIN|nr:conserved hypothetical protein [Leishmania infantum JPCM5]CAC9505046.1 Putative_serine_esterase_(DUF676)_-_putative [Leishmania infantum]CAM69483.1 conserved hypothetical protein [Leishmania infantum JPCM5]SUZ43426.1 Putative_serine_esterase_(DUF676)_-_putative [Leishmania infantum]|eukprot:XP_001470288.1 conserved hypothetical protein [Leishmania infantum JPCM5]
MELALGHAESLASAPLHAPPRTLCIVLLHHGYRSKASDFRYLCRVCKQALKDLKTNATKANDGAPPLPTPRFVFIPPRDNDGLKMDAGVLACARRYVRQVCLTVYAIVAEELGIGDEQSCVAAKATGATADSATTAVKHKLCFSAVGHSMGGLILRAALPELIKNIEEKYEAFKEVCEVHWDVFCTLATPHLGLRYMHSKRTAFLGRHVGCHLWKAMADLFCRNSVVGVDLVSDACLAAWSRFKRRVLVNVVNDDTVLAYSSSFVTTLRVLRRVGASLPSTDEELADARSTKKKNDYLHSDSCVLQLARLGVKCASSRKELCDNGVIFTNLSPELWPLDVLVEERALAERILMHVAPLELHLVDFRPRCARLTSAAASRGTGGGNAARRPGILAREMMIIGATHSCHMALVCKKPFRYPSVFGFVSEYIAKDLLLGPLGGSEFVSLPQDGLLQYGAACNGCVAEVSGHRGMLDAAEVCAAPARSANA